MSYPRRITFDAADMGLIDALSDAHQAILLAKGTYSQISVALNLPLGTVRSRLNRARAALVAERARVAAELVDNLA